jgi:hypothetical protein
MNLKKGCIWPKVAYAKQILNKSLVPILHVPEHTKSNRWRFFLRKLFHKHEQKIFACLCILAFNLAVTTMIYAFKKEYKYEQSKIQHFAVSYRTYMGNGGN